MAGLLKTLEFCSLEEEALGLFSLISLLFPNSKQLRRQNHVASTFCVYCQILLKIKDNFPIFFFLYLWDSEGATHGNEEVGGNYLCRKGKPTLH